ncbi:uncharacterized protein BO88DRAFT_453585 [Aspergillus vadensis CBS 113365]|uniref:SMP domain-containing protein n=1 Tax=Aspergillus vadensis (strain CBS 113365 / IMI 142717 / IBT 24658) TaxID=1448311 RepID=A0A319B9B0_ASPVC|nr:hypothetical protein BO88DRAFT_453585 [Aspergillus vadensis CBS 113365]PYH69135.1 hypothetical protein BO88DRAFT_453585 [Aspergillus vadensis CBS 113365]
MSSEIPDIPELKRAVESGQRIGPDDVSALAPNESKLTGGGPIRGGAAGVFIGLDVQMNFDKKLEAFLRKPQSYITQEDARELHTEEGRAFNKPPGPGSVSAQIRSIADRNEALGVPAMPGEVPVYITTDEAREAQHAESTIYGGQNPRVGIAAQMHLV